MKRRALIIASNDGNIPGVDADANNLKDFLTSPTGGLWQNNEIQTLINPTLDILNKQLDLLTTADYSFISFGGHGRFNTLTDQDEIFINKTHTISANMLYRGATKHTVIIDSCRNLYHPIKTLKFEASASRSIALDSTVKHREVFDAHLRASANGIVKIKSCSKTESANDSSSGGLYTYSLLMESKRKTSNIYGNKVIDIKQAHELAKIKTLSESGFRQNPEIMHPRSEILFPFAISD